jgi:hypothetical protein
MTENSTSPSGGSKRGLIIGGSVIVALAVVYFAFFYPPASVRDTEGTIGAVKKYRAEQITEKDVVLEGMTSMNMEAVQHAVQQTSGKAIESAREAGKAAEELLATARTAETRAFAEGVKTLAAQAEAFRTAGFGYKEVAAFAEAARENAAKAEQMTAEARTPQLVKVQEAVAAMEKTASGFRALSLRSEYMRLSDAARLLAVQAEAVRMQGNKAEWNKLAEGALALARQAEEVKMVARQEDAGRLAESALAFGRLAQARAGASGKQAAGEASKVMDAAKQMAGRAEALARPAAEGSAARPE